MTWLVVIVDSPALRCVSTARLQANPVHDACLVQVYGSTMRDVLILDKMDHPVDCRFT